MAQLVSERKSYVEYRACFVRCSERLRRPVCSAEHVGNQLLNGHGISLDQRLSDRVAVVRLAIPIGDKDGRVRADGAHV